jgi:long-chain acyl-CoA synthetase
LDFLRLTDILPYRRHRFTNNKAFAFIRHGTLHFISTTQAIDIIESLYKAIINAGIRPGDRVILMAEHNQPQWIFHDLALLRAGAVVVPVQATATDDEIDWMLNETSSRYAFTSGESLKTKLSKYQLKVWFFEGPEALPLLPDHALKPVAPSNPETAMATIIYTSDASGVPKGVMLSHHNIVSNIKSVLTLVPIEARHRVFSFLPLSHVFERMVTYAYLATGACIYYPEHAGTLMRDFRICQPHYFTAVPRVLEKLYSGIRHKAMKQAAFRQSLFNWAVKTGQAFHTGNALSPFYRLQLLLAGQSARLPTLAKSPRRTRTRHHGWRCRPQPTTGPTLLRRRHSRKGRIWTQ